MSTFGDIYSNAKREVRARGQRTTGEGFQDIYQREKRKWLIGSVIGFDDEGNRVERNFELPLVQKIFPRHRVDVEYVLEILDNPEDALESPIDPGADVESVGNAND